MTVKLYDGCYGVTRGGEGEKQEVSWPITYDPSTAWPAHPFVSLGSRWAEDGIRAYENASRDIIAVFPTREEAEAHLAGKTAEAPKFREVGSTSPFRLSDGTWINIRVAPDKPAPKPVTWPDGVEKVKAKRGWEITFVRDAVSVSGMDGLYGKEAARQLAALLLAAADYVEGGEK